MANAMEEEAAEKIALKEAEIAELKKRRLQSCEFNAEIGSRLGVWTSVPNYLVTSTEIEKAVAQLRQGFLGASIELGYQEHMCRLRIAVDKQFLLLKEDVNNLRGCNLHDDAGTGCTGKLLQINERIDGLKILLASSFEKMTEMFGLVKALVLEHQYEHELQKDIAGVMIQDYVRSLQDEFDMKLWEQNNLKSVLNKNWEKKVSELTALRDELDAVSSSIAGSELGMLCSQSSIDVSEERSFLKRKDSLSDGNGSLLKEKSGDSAMLEIPDFPLLKHLSGDEMIAFFKSETLKMRRQHETALHEKTEELFRLKRDFLKEKGSLPFRKDREFEFLKTKLPQIVSKLDEIISKKENIPFNCSYHDEMCRLKDRIDFLVYENECLQGLLADKKEEAKHLSSQVSDVACKLSLHSSSEAELLNQMKKIKGELEDLKTEGHLRDLLHQTILREIVGDYENYMDDVKIHSEVLQETYSAVLFDALSIINLTMREHHVEQALLKEMLVERETMLSVKNEEHQKLEQTVTTLSILKDENEQLVSATGSTSMQQEQFNLVNHELDMLRDKVNKQELVILESKKESDLMKSNLDEALQQIHEFKQEASRLAESLKSVSNALEEAKKENVLLHGTIEKEKMLEPSIGNDKEKVRRLEFIVICMAMMSKAFSDFESRLAETIRRNEIRLANMNRQFHPLVQQVVLLKRKEFWYKQMLEIKCSNLQKAEVEVDLLGDEVDTLLSLLGKIYVALDHYSPVLQHYPGVIEILRLVQKVLQGESI